MRIADTLEGNRAMKRFFLLLGSFLLGNRCTSRKRDKKNHRYYETSVNYHA